MSFERVDADTLRRVREFYTEDGDADGTIKMLARALEAAYGEIDRLSAPRLGPATELRVGQVRIDPDPRMRGRCVRILELGHRAVYGRNEHAVLVEPVRLDENGRWCSRVPKTRIRADRIVRWKLAGEGV